MQPKHSKGKNGGRPAFLHARRPTARGENWKTPSELPAQTELQELEPVQTFTVPFNENIEFTPPHPAFWRAIVDLSYNAGPLSFDVRFTIEPHGRVRQIILPGWMMSVDYASASIRFRETE